MLIVALVMAVIGLAALVTAVVTSNEIIAWVCIGASVIGVVLLIVDALRERARRDTKAAAADDTEAAAADDTKAAAADDIESDADYPDEDAGEEDAPAANTKSEPEEHKDSETSQ
jgi:hypothetical protein